jgi:hypothetical protein
VGTVSVDKSEELSAKLKKCGIPHNVLNAKHHEREAEIVAQAGKFGAVTISTNMAGRGTDIKLGEGVKELGGLHVIGSSRHDSRRIDRQLRGRCSRQGDPGSSKFYVSLEDDLMRLFGGDRIVKIFDRFGLNGDEKFIMYNDPESPFAYKERLLMVSCFVLNGKTMIMVMNDTKSPVKELSFSAAKFQKLGVNISALEDAESGKPVPVANGVIKVDIPARDYRILISK